MEAKKARVKGANFTMTSKEQSDYIGISPTATPNGGFPTQGALQTVGSILIHTQGAVQTVEVILCGGGRRIQTLGEQTDRCKTPSQARRSKRKRLTMDRVDTSRGAEPAACRTASSRRKVAQFFMEHLF